MVSLVKSAAPSYMVAGAGGLTHLRVQARDGLVMLTAISPWGATAVAALGVVSAMDLALGFSPEMGYLYVPAVEGVGSTRGVEVTSEFFLGQPEWLVTLYGPEYGAVRFTNYGDLTHALRQAAADAVEAGA